MLRTRTHTIIEALVDGDKQCRRCKHPKYYHLQNKRCMGTKMTKKRGALHICRCEEFVPLDNLDYVEYLARKRGIVK